jgi:S1-C subfamily serine protease
MPVRSGTQLRNVIGLTRIGSDVDLRIDRRGSEHSIGVKVEAAAPATPARQSRGRQQ